MPSADVVQDVVDAEPVQGEGERRICVSDEPAGVNESYAIRVDANVCPPPAPAAR
jgi:hypothetical protein